MDKIAFQGQFLGKIENRDYLGRLFDFLPNIFFFVKDEKSRFIMANQSFLNILGVKNEADMIGLCDHDFFPKNIADSYLAEDRYVLEHRTMTRDRLWLVPDSDNTLKWYVSTKIPLFDKAGRVAGLAGTMTSFGYTDRLPEPFKEMSAVVQYINDHFSEPIEAATLARLACLSISQFDRRFKKVFGQSPLKYITKTRIEAACVQLDKTHLSITQIANRTGFGDHSYFTKVFFKVTGTTPIQYRKNLRKNPTDA
jgi:AraC-like DNA-binding protein